jgi:hypothetical protein
MSFKPSGSDGTLSFSDSEDLLLHHMLHTECGQATSYHILLNIPIF